jgi:uncharacterized protein YjlB
VHPPVTILPLHIPFGKVVPNHPRWPILIYRQVFAVDSKPNLADRFAKDFESHRWQGIWRWGVYPFHHYHSTAHEVLGVAAGVARLALGGPQGEEYTVEAGDVILLPAGAGHRCVMASDDFEVVGAYPEGQETDMIRAGEADSALMAERIKEISLPKTDPLFGPDGPLFEYWRSDG